MPLSLISLRALGENECTRGLESIPTTYSNSFAHCACSLSSQSASPLSSSEHSPSSRAMMESSLFFTDGEFCPSVSQYRGKFAVLRYLVELQKHIKRRLDKGEVINVNDRSKPVNPHGEIGDSSIDRLLL